MTHSKFKQRRKLALFMFYYGGAVNAYQLRLIEIYRKRTGAHIGRRMFIHAAIQRMHGGK